MVKCGHIGFSECIVKAISLKFKIKPRLDVCENCGYLALCIARNSTSTLGAHNNDQHSAMHDAATIAPLHVTAGQDVSGSIPGSGKVLLSFFRFFENFSVVARSLGIMPSIRQYVQPPLHGTNNSNGEKVDILRFNRFPPIRISSRSNCTSKPLLFRAEVDINDCLVGAVIVSATARQGFSGSIQSDRVNTKSGIVPRVWQKAHLDYMVFIRKLGVRVTVALRAITCTSAYPFGDKASWSNFSFFNCGGKENLRIVLCFICDKRGKKTDGPDGKQASLWALTRPEGFGWFGAWGFFTRDVLCYVIVDAFGFHQSYLLVHVA
ncbi:hypothetical protein SFRURICE_018259 [Spodoptera frugiperda]|nr:hypothetical protein SFRURICE_018259 [Spodoptera frugiperda]